MTYAVVAALLSAFLGVPLYLVIGGLAVTLYFLAGDPVAIVFIEYFRLAATSALVAIPLFTLAGFMLARSSSPRRFVRLATAAMGSLPGSLALVTLLTCALFTAFTGASGVTIIALGGLLYPVLKQNGYGEDFSLGLVTTSGSVGLLFAPSLPLILYGIVSGVKVDDLFIAGILPGAIIILFLALYSWWKARSAGVRTQKFDRRELWSALLDAKWELPIPIFVLIGIYSGAITAEEAAACVCTYVFLVACVFRRELGLRKDIPAIAKESMVLVGSILMILGMAVALTGFLVNEEVPDHILGLVKSTVHSRLEFLIWLNVFLLVIGCLMDIFSAIVIVLPLLIPLAAEYQVHPVHLAMIFLTNLEIGYSTPPLGLNLFVASFRFKKPILTLYRVSVPYLVMLLVALLVITYVPDISLVLLKLFGMPGY